MKRIEKLAEEYAKQLPKRGLVVSEACYMNGIRKGIELCRKELGDRASRLDRLMTRLDEEEPEEK